MPISLWRVEGLGVATRFRILWQHPTLRGTKTQTEPAENLPLHLLQRLTLSLGDALLRDRVRRAEFLGEEANTQFLKTGVMISVLTLRHSDVQHPYQTGEPANLDLQLYYEES